LARSRCLGCCKADAEKCNGDCAHAKLMSHDYLLLLDVPRPTER
jgi:hypothetical protein